MPRRNIPWSLTVANIGGIPIRIHATFLLILLWAAAGEQNVSSAANEVIFVLIVFACVALHELGHAFAAAFYKIKTRDIILYPFGGVATILGDPSPKGEIVIAIAGPLVNLVIAILLWGLLQIDLIFLSSINQIIVRALEANLFLTIFNMIPALPMDGGRVLRATLQLRGSQRATSVASSISQGISILLGVFALFIGNPFLVAISVLVFMGASQEALHAKTKLGAQGQRVRDVMTPRSSLEVLRHGMTLTEALTIGLRSAQPSFPVMYGERVMGVVHREILLQNVALNEEQDYISGIMERDFAKAQAEESIENVVDRATNDDRDPIIVEDGEDFVGALFRERLFEFLLVQGIRKERKERDEEAEATTVNDNT